MESFIGILSILLMLIVGTLGLMGALQIFDIRASFAECVGAWITVILLITIIKNI